MKKFAVLFRVWQFVLRQEKTSFLWAAGLLATGLYAAGTAWLSKYVIDSILAPRHGIVEWIPRAVLGGIGYGLITLLHALITSSATIELLNIKDKVGNAADELLMNKVSDSPDISAFEFPETRDKIRMASNGAKSLPGCFSGSIDVIQHVVTVIALSAILIYYHPLLIIFIFVPSIPLFYRSLALRSHSFATLVYKSPQYRQMAYFIDLMLGTRAAKEIRVYEGGRLFLDKYNQVADEIFAVERANRWKAAIGTILWGTIAAAGIGSAYLYIIYLATVKRIGVGDVVMYSGTVFYAGGAIRNLIQAASSLWTNILVVDSFFNLLDEPAVSMAVVRTIPPTLNVATPEWSLKNVSFSYAGRQEKVLKDITFDIRPKEKIAIVGLNGVGKTTLLKLMLGLLSPEEGKIRFRGIDLQQCDLSALRAMTGVVFQDFARFKVTLYENIALAANGRLSLNGDGDVVLKAAEWAGVDEIAKAVPCGYQTLLGKEFQDGTDLSGGQWQKVALARAMAGNSPIVLLDEPSSSLDAKAEQAMFQRVIALAEEKTTIVISHRLSITPLVDTVFVIADGRIVEKGSHHQLMESGAQYAQMYKTQSEMYWPRTG